MSFWKLFLINVYVHKLYQGCISCHFSLSLSHIYNILLGTQWLVKEHKKCISELEHLKGLITDLHRWIDLIHERGQALYSAFSELRKHLEDLQRQIKGLHKKIHDNDVIIQRLRKELDDWKQKASKLRSEVDGLQAKYIQIEKEHEAMKKDMEACDKER